MRLIDADAIPYNYTNERGVPMTREIDIQNMPTIEERKTGKWINNIHDIPICDQCGYMTPYDRAIDDYEYGNYCPNCGTKMEGDQS